jgi:squalene-hopene/tetraprenyl-beta-curcumene cyclase
MLGHTAAEEPIARAVAFLRAQQCVGGAANGAWWGRWVVNYLAATAWALRGLAAVGADREAAWVRSAIAFLIEHQNADGGWGEDVASYRDEGLAGIGSSTAGLTGLVMSALVAIGERGSRSVAAAVEYLVREQTPEGTWSNGTLLHALVPPDLFYVLPGAPEQLALEGLAGALPP